MKLVMEKRLAPSPLMRSLVPVVAAFAALVFCGIFFAVTGRDPFEVYYAMFSGALGSEYGISETIVKMIPLAMCGLGIAIAFRMQIWNIGAEGQFYMGACAASWLPLTYPDLPSMIMLPGMLDAIRTLSYRVCAMGLEPELTRFHNEIEVFQSPFMVQNTEVNAYLDAYTNLLHGNIEHIEDARHLLVMLDQCDAVIAKIRKKALYQGTSIPLTYLLVALAQSIDRLRKLLFLVDTSGELPGSVNVDIAAITSVVSLIEVVTQFVIQKFHAHRKRAALIVAGVCFLVSIPIGISLGHVAILEESSPALFGLDWLTFFDEVTNTVLMPVCALFSCIVVGWFITPKRAVAEIDASSVPTERTGPWR